MPDFNEPDALKNIIILIVVTGLAYLLSRYVALGIIKIAQTISVRADRADSQEKTVQLRQVETYLSIAVAVVRAAVVVVVAYVVWKLIYPNANSAITAIGAGTLFIVVAGQTIAPILRDITIGSIMIGEQWFTVGDFIKVEPFMDVSGVVERFTLRSTQLRSLNGEVIWIHNQQISSVHVTPRGVRTISVDIFMQDKDKALKTLDKLIKAIPVGPTMLAQPMTVGEPEEWGSSWRVTVTGQTLPGREWLIERFFVNAIIEVDADIDDKSKRTFMYEPIARFTDPVADRQLKRAVRARKLPKV